jgi:transcriptional regulator GlxA family with amidase domain
MHIAILTFEGYNELDSMIALGILNRIRKPDWRVSIASPAARVRSMNGVVLEAQASLAEAAEADAVLVGSSRQTRAIVADTELMAQLHLDPARQLVGAQCSGALILAKLGLLHDVPACTDLVSKPWVEEAGVATLNQPFFAKGNVATAGGCLASQYLASWVIARLLGIEAARGALHYVAPVGEKEMYIERMMRNVTPYLEKTSVMA